MGKELSRGAMCLLLVLGLGMGQQLAQGQEFVEAEFAHHQQFVPTEFAPAEPAPSEGKKRWLLSAVALIAGSALDAHASQSRYEMNPLLRDANGTFSNRRGFVIKSAAGGGMLLLQAILIKRNPDRNLYRPFALTNGIIAGVTAGAAFRNYQTPRAAIPPPAYVLAETGNQ
jgi:hypothetical protein